MSQSDSAQVTIYIATINTARAAELCIRSIRAHTPRNLYRLHICDSGSEDGSLPKFTRLLHAGMIDDLTVVPSGRAHGDWLDWWATVCPTPFGVALDSDIEILEDGWLELLLDTANRQQAPLVTPEIIGEVPGYVDHTGVPRRLARRPAPWMMLFDPEKCRPLGSWRVTMDVDDTIPEGWWGLDTGAAIMRELEKRGLDAAEAPTALRGKFRHYGGMSWVRALENRPGWRLKAKRLKVRLLDLYVLWRIAVVRRLAARS
jgi:hypothetical protein